MKILFFGSKGWIGRQFCEYLNENNILYIESDLRADNEKDVEKEINEYKNKVQHKRSIPTVT